MESSRESALAQDPYHSHIPPRNQPADRRRRKEGFFGTTEVGSPVLNFGLFTTLCHYILNTMNNQPTSYPPHYVYTYIPPRTTNQSELLHTYFQKQSTSRLQPEESKA